MKKFLRTTQFATLVFFLYGAVLISLIGCAGKGQYSPPAGTNTTGLYSPELPASTLVVTVEKVRETALGVFDSVMKTEAANRDALAAVSPGFHAFAERIRRDGQMYLNTLTKAKTAFQQSRSQSDATALTEALATVQSLIADSVKYLAEAVAAKKPQ